MKVDRNFTPRPNRSPRPLSPPAPPPSLDMTTCWLWEQLHELFDTDDGSLPEIEVWFTRPESIPAAYGLIQKHAGCVITRAPTIQLDGEPEERLLESVLNPAALVAAGRAHEFHLVFGGVERDGVPIPDLGVFVYHRTVCLDYRMGSEWTARSLRALFALLFDLAQLEPDVAPRLEDVIAADQRAAFDDAWQRWVDGPPGAQ